jgi:hypothetical protein
LSHFIGRRSVWLLLTLLHFYRVILQRTTDLTFANFCTTQGGLTSFVGSMKLCKRWTKDGKWETSAEGKLKEHKDTPGSGMGVVAVGSANPRAGF